MSINSKHTAANHSHSEISIRRCRPADAEQAVPLIYSAGPNAFDYVFCSRDKSQSLAFLHQAFNSENSEFSYNQHWAVTVNDVVVGTLCIRDASRQWQFLSSALVQIVRSYSWREILGVIWRGLQTEQVMALPSSKRTPLICHVGVNSQFRGRGLAQGLINHALTQMQQQGATTALLNVAADNDNARRLYQHLGFTSSGEQVSQLRSELGFVETQQRMAKDLSQ